ncbi:MAG: HPr kinase/phosphatase C-terminal domain-containing protein [Proteobacteria bacterium]|nr:HPr kinase/phosphatase C-terminal domain-containing protein [Pseudomonadota bacterium]
METVHATTVAIGGRGVLLRGPSGSGKSDLALRLIDGGADLVADDRTILDRAGDGVIASSPPSICGKIEIRGLGIVRLPALEQAMLALVVDISPAEIERLPMPETVNILGFDLPLLRIAPMEASAPAKIRLAVRAKAGDIER